jgi:hypothetical protein
MVVKKFNSKLTEGLIINTKFYESRFSGLQVIWCMDRDTLIDFTIVSFF